MKNLWLLLFGCLLMISSCKKDEDEESAPGITFTSTSGYTTSLPKTVTFTASTSSADAVNWDFGDGSTGTGFTVQHTYTAYGNYKVKATVVKGSQSASLIRDLPITFHRRAKIKSIKVIQIPTFKPGGFDWDPGDAPDLMYKLTFPGDTLYEPTTVLNNSTTGTFTLSPPQGSYIFNEDIRIELFDYDLGNVPDKEKLGEIPFCFCDVIPTSVNYTDSVDISTTSMRVLVKFEFEI